MFSQYTNDIITRADKRCVTVIMNKRDYTNKINLMLVETTYKKLKNQDPTTYIQNSASIQIKIFRSHI